MAKAAKIERTQKLFLKAMKEKFAGPTGNLNRLRTRRS